MPNDNTRSQFYMEVESVFGRVTGWLPEGERSTFQELLVLPTLEIIQEVIDDSRSPVFFLVGRSGHGKSSLINKLAGKPVTRVHPVKPQTSKTEAHDIYFEDLDATWTVVDSRGIFETDKPDEAVNEASMEDLIKDIVTFKPDIILHVISALEVKALSEDFKVVAELRNRTRSETGLNIPFIAVINKCDSLGKRPLSWPPEEYEYKEGLIQATLDYMVKGILDVHVPEEIMVDGRRRALICPDNERYVAVVPISCIADEPWNLGVLSDVLEQYLPSQAHMQFIKAQNRRTQLLRASDLIVSRFSNAAAATKRHPNLFRQLIGLLYPVLDGPLPGLTRVNLVPFWPLAISMVALIGWLSGRRPANDPHRHLGYSPFTEKSGSELSIDVATEYFAALGIKPKGETAEEISQMLWDLFQDGKNPATGRFSRRMIEALGESAKAYFFDNEIVYPRRWL